MYRLIENQQGITLLAMPGAIYESFDRLARAGRPAAPSSVGGTYVVRP